MFIDLIYSNFSKASIARRSWGCNEPQKHLLSLSKQGQLRLLLQTNITSGQNIASQAKVSGRALVLKVRTNKTHEKQNRFRDRRDPQRRRYETRSRTRLLIRILAVIGFPKHHVSNCRGWAAWHKTCCDWPRSRVGSAWCETTLLNKSRRPFVIARLSQKA